MNLENDELQVYCAYSENQLAHIYEPAPGVFIAESPKVILRALEAGYEPISLLKEAGRVEPYSEEVFARLGSIPVYELSHEELKKLTGYELTRGMLCAMRRKTLPDLESWLEKHPDFSRIVILENVENPTNVGAIVRSAAALYMDGVILTSGCADPLYRRAIRVSMGTIFQVPFTKMRGSVSWPAEGIELLRAHGYKTVAMALREDSVMLTDPDLMAEEKLAFIMGTEGDGLMDETLSRCDYTVKIPMSHGVDSLNVAAAAAVAFYQLGVVKK